MLYGVRIDPFNCWLITGAGVDYVAVSAELQFTVGDEKVCHQVVIIDDDDCEPSPETFFADLSLLTGDLVTVLPNFTLIIIDDTNENDCG